MYPLIDHINRFVSDVEKHISFYVDVLGYELIDHGIKANGSKYAILKGLNHELFISEKKDFLVDDKNFRHIGYSVDNADEFLDKMKKAGYAKEKDTIIVKPYSRQFYLKDPDGLQIDIIQWTDKNKFYNDLEKKNLKVEK